LKVEPASGLDCSGDFKAAPDIRISGPAAGGGYVLRTGPKVKVSGRQADPATSGTATFATFRRHWPATRIRVITNGFFLHRHPELSSVLAAVGNSDLTLSVHYDGPGYAERLRPVHDLLASWQRDHGIVVQTLQSHQGWTRRYLGYGDEMLPFEDGLPRQSWEICPARHCKQRHDGKIWKCAPLAYLGMQEAKYELSGKWDPYLSHLQMPLA
jgi:hypothetical protein